jgi:hypothetical protein
MLWPAAEFQALGKPQVPPLRFAPVGMTIPLYAQVLQRDILTLEKNCHPDWRNHGPLAHPMLVKASSRSATNLHGSAAIPFVISTGAQRSGEISVWMLSLGNVFSTERNVVQGPAVLSPEQLN